MQADDINRSIAEVGKHIERIKHNHATILTSFQNQSMFLLCPLILSIVLWATVIVLFSFQFTLTCILKLKLCIDLSMPAYHLGITFVPTACRDDNERLNTEIKKLSHKIHGQLKSELPHTITS